MKIDDVKILPQWIAKMYAGKTGRDHLGLGSVSSDQILPSLSPSINVLTFHPRYHSFYVFLLDEYWQRVPEKSSQYWKDFFRPRDYIYSLGIHLHNDTHGEMRNIVGGRKVSPMALKALDKYPTQYDYIDSELGGYGLYYRTVMAELGLIYPAVPGQTPVDVPSEFGRKLAEAFRQAVKNTTYYKKYFEQNTIEVPREVIYEYVQQACLCQLKKESAPDRSLVLETFLHKGNLREATARRATFRLLLDIADQTNGYALDEDQFTIPSPKLVE